MNKITKCLCVGLMAMGFTACADLDLNPLSEGSSENWYHDATEIEMSLNDLWRPEFFPIDGLEWDDDLLNWYGFRTLDCPLQSYSSCYKSAGIFGERNSNRSERREGKPV